MHAKRVCFFLWSPCHPYGCQISRRGSRECEPMSTPPSPPHRPALLAGINRYCTPASRHVTSIIHTSGEALALTQADAKGVQPPDCVALAAGLENKVGFAPETAPGRRHGQLQQKKRHAPTRRNNRRELERIGAMPLGTGIRRRRRAVAADTRSAAHSRSEGWIGPSQTRPIQGGSPCLCGTHPIVAIPSRW